MAKKHVRRVMPIVLSVATLLVIGFTLFVLSGNFSNLVTTITKSRASTATPQITQSYSDLFKSDAINQDKWDVGMTGTVRVFQSAADNLQFNIPEGAKNKTQKIGSVQFKQLLKDNADFRVTAIIYRPVVTGDGSGATGIKFSSTGSKNDEAVSLRWIVNKSGTNVTSNAIFRVNGADGKPVIVKSEPINTNVAVFRLVRVNGYYRGTYQLGADTSADSASHLLGETPDSATGLGQDGKVSLFTSNGGTPDKYPKVLGRIDQVSIGWQGKPLPSGGPKFTGFNDAFANGVLAQEWTVSPRSGTSVEENSTNNLVMTIIAGAYNNRQNQALATRNSPVIPVGKDFTIRTQLLKPKIVGAGSGAAGVSFRTYTNVDLEAATLQWVVSATTSRLTFGVRAPNGAVVENSSVNVTAKKLTLVLQRTGDKYTAWYRTGDSDTNLVQVGAVEKGALGTGGKVGLFARNVGADNKFPFVIAQFDFASGSVEN